MHIKPLPNWVVVAKVQPQPNTPDRKRETKIHQQCASMAIRLQYIHAVLCIPEMPLHINTSHNYINIFAVVYNVHIRRTTLTH